MQSFRVLEHTAGVGFEAFGATCQKAFANAARGLGNLVVDLETIAPREEVALQIQTPDPASMLDEEAWLFRDIEIQSLQDNSLSALASGEKFRRSSHPIKLLVRAITCHQLTLKKTSQGWRAQVYVDI